MARAGRIRLLPESIINQIAAGEVVERPASVVKELVENSLDAGAERISVEISGGGVQMVRVVDDGHGMSPDELLLALERHATSKISSAGDLSRVSTLGFRGEALPSIAAVSRMRLRSRARDQNIGAEAFVVGGTLKQFTEKGCAPGTMVEVRGLFFNTPARRKFLKSPATEAAHIAKVLTRMILGWPEVRFTYTAGRRTPRVFEASSRPIERIAQVLGEDVAGQMLELDWAFSGIRLTGAAALPSLSRPRADQIYIFINRRYVREPVVAAAVEEAYQGRLAPGRRPVVVLFISLDPALVDVNVHPAKTEVRLRNAQSVRQAVVEGLRAALASARGSARSSSPSPRPTPAPPRLPAATPTLRSPTSRPAPQPTPAVQALFNIAGELKVLGQLHGLYILCSSPQGLVIVDQHAAHERLMYERLRQALASGPLPTQPLLSPVVVQLSPEESALVERHGTLWERLGMELVAMGKGDWAVAALPAALAGTDPRTVLKEILSELAHAPSPATPEAFADQALKALACRSAIKQGQQMDTLEMQRLVEQLSALPGPLTCPHGRPILLHLSRQELDKCFKRSTAPRL